jgi:hypothetical protein
MKIIICAFLTFCFFNVGVLSSQEPMMDSGAGSQYYVQEEMGNTLETKYEFEKCRKQGLLCIRTTKKT